MVRKTLLTATGFFLMTSSVQAFEFQPLGFESMSMGGAGVASANASLAGYYNPALLSIATHDAEISFGVGIGLRDNDLAESMDKLAEDYELSDTLERIADNASQGNPVSQEDRDNITDSLQVIQDLANDDNGLSIMPTAFLGMQGWQVGVGVYATSDATASAIIDPDHLKLMVEDEGVYYEYSPINDSYNEISQSVYENESLEYALDNGLTYVQLNGLALIEVPVSYAHSFDVGVGKLSVGGSLKFMRGTTFTSDIKIDTETGDLDDEFDDAEEESNDFGIDAGVLFQPGMLPDLLAGLTIKNINGPEFDLSTGGSVKVDPQARTGVSYSLLNDKVEVAADLDITKNDTFLVGQDSQFFGLGANWHPLSWFSVRAGLMRNLSGAEEGTVYTAGVGFGFKWIQLDVAAQMSSGTIEYDGKDYPKYTKLNLALVSKW